MSTLETVAFDPAAPSVTVRTRLAWVDTDAAVRWHYAVILRWAEACEAELHRHLGLVSETFGWTPRVKIEADFQAMVQFDDLVEMEFRVARVGRTSVTYTFEVHLVDEQSDQRGDRAGGGTVVTVLTGDDGVPTAWPDHMRTALAGESATDQA